VNAIEESGVTLAFVQGFSDLSSYFTLVIETPLPIFHLAPEICACQTRAFQRRMRVEWGRGCADERLDADVARTQGQEDR
jgi:hypothetical protein